MFEAEIDHNVYYDVVYTDASGALLPRDEAVWVRRDAVGPTEAGRRPKGECISR